ncbi:hypothetical protein EB796_012069 [Bugula neritina]|uniref:Uncharacterized protein n=1 Tax=Bugula neritina TaxID=10212 RepID=A0A7J7JUK5_BUGNE|nr:hypothetical protein EB796_012069 [Bugula neritina]
MLLFGGSHSLWHSCNELWLFDIKRKSWLAVNFSKADAPQPRFGAFLCALSDCQALMMGGCGGANQKFHDCWVVTFQSQGHDLTAIWTQMEVNHTQCSSKLSLWSLNACKVGDSITVVSKVSHPVDAEVLARISPRSKSASIAANSFSASSDDDDSLSQTERLESSDRTGRGVRQTPQMRRERRLELLKKFEDKLKERNNLRAVANVRQNAPLKNPMFLHTLDISNIDSGYVTWTPPNTLETYGESRQELILVGGFHSDRNTDIQRSSSESSSVTLNESVYIISGT